MVITYRSVQEGLLKEGNTTKIISVNKRPSPGVNSQKFKLLRPLCDLETSPQVREPSPSSSTYFLHQQPFTAFITLERCPVYLVSFRNFVRLGSWAWFWSQSGWKTHCSSPYTCSHSPEQRLSSMHAHPLPCCDKILWTEAIQGRKGSIWFTLQATVHPWENSG